METVETNKSSIKKVLFIDTGLSFGGSLVVAARIANEINAFGYQSVVVTPVEKSLIQHHFNDDVVIVNEKKPITYKDKMELADKLAKIKLSPLRKLISLTYNLIEVIKNRKYTANIRKTIIEHNIDIVHNNNCYDSIKVCKKMGVKVIWHFHGYLNDSSRTTRKWLSQCDHFIAISQCVYDSAAESDFIPKEKLTKLFNPIQSQITQYTKADLNNQKAKLGVSEDKFVIGVFGRLVGWKGQLEFLDAYQDFCAQFPNSIAMFVGDDSEYGGYKQQLVEKIDALKLNDNIVFAGYVTETDLHYQLCDLVVHCSIKPEPFGLVITEAMQNQRPIIASTHGAGKELVEHGKNGFIADPLNPKELSKYMLDAANNQALREAFIVNANHFVSSLNARDYAKAISAIYNNVL